MKSAVDTIKKESKHKIETTTKLYRQLGRWLLKKKYIIALFQQLLRVKCVNKCININDVMNDLPIKRPNTTQQLFHVEFVLNIRSFVFVP